MEKNKNFITIITVYKMPKSLSAAMPFCSTFGLTNISKEINPFSKNNPAVIQNKCDSVRCLSIDLNCVAIVRKEKTNSIK